MKYEIVSLNEKMVAGFSAKTNNTSPEMSAVIGGLWQKLYSKNGCLELTNRTNNKAVGIYTNYAGNHLDDYTVITACEVKNAENIPANMEIHKIPKGKYAKFIVRGNMITAVAEFWEKLWKMDLDRNFICDFEEYQNADPENAEIHIYIGLQEDKTTDET